jgi:hypothetical protein
MEPLSPFASNPVKSRNDVAKFLIGLLDALEKHTSKGGALIKIGWTGAHFDEAAAQVRNQCHLFRVDLWLYLIDD